jgi:hypothetical protein
MLLGKSGERVGERTMEGKDVSFLNLFLVLVFCVTFSLYYKVKTIYNFVLLLDQVKLKPADGFCT